MGYGLGQTAAGKLDDHVHVHADYDVDEYVHGATDYHDDEDGLMQ